MTIRARGLAVLAALATACPVIARADDDVSSRLARVQTALDDAASPASRWRDGWLIAYGALALGQGGIGFAVDHDQKPSLFVGAAKSTIGFLAVLIAPLPATSAGAELRALPEATPEQQKAKLLVGETLLDEAAKSQRLARGLLAQVGALVVNGAGAIVLWKGYHQGGQGVLSLVTGMAVSEVQILTVPTGVIDARDAYKNSVRVTIAPTLGGAMVLGSF